MERLWAPWRSKYIAGLANDDQNAECFLCAGREGEDAAAHLVLGRGEHCFIIMNLFPYNTGHLMVSCNQHTGEIEDLSAEATGEMWRFAVLCKTVLGEVMQPHGFNLGINQGRCSGAGVTDHLHLHIVPRWDGDTNFMTVLGETRVMSQALADLYKQLRPIFAQHGVSL